ncbi:MAG TPA: SUF system NifU family Fe-S cluster assembly protein [Gammaproteobacteria bacterium]|nr:SUF system NifU family Fe-S cluster assembly protein [Gammaproteobacteria bacterium]
MMDLRALYEEVILDHNRNPRNYPKRPEGTNHTAEGHNPLCGDHVSVHLRMENGVIQDVGFEGDGCAISTASASLMTEALKGKSEADARVLFDRIHDALMSDGATADEVTESLGKLAVLLGVKQYPMRVKCATLPWHTLQAALKRIDEPVTTE